MPSNQSKTNASSIQKKLVIFASDKGGVGKSKVAKVTLEYLRTTPSKSGAFAKVAAFDADPQVRQLAKTYEIKNDHGSRDDDANLFTPLEGVRHLDVRKDPESITETLDENADIILIDAPGGAVDFTGAFGTMDAFKAEFKREGYEIILMLVINNEDSCAESVGKIMEIWGSDVTFVVVKNLAFGDKDAFIYFDGEQAHELDNPAKKLLEAGGKIIEFPALDPASFALQNRWKLPFRAAIERLEVEKENGSKRWRARRGFIAEFIQKSNAALAPLGLLD